MKSPSASSAADHALKLVVSAPPSVDLMAFFQDLARLADSAVLRNYQLGTLDALRMETRRFSQFLSQEVSIAVHALIGHHQYNALQEILLSNADGILLLLDMEPRQRQASMQTVVQTIQNLQRQGVDLRQFPVVFLYHRAELTTPADLQEWDQLLELEHNQMPRFYCATEFGSHGAQAMEALIARALEVLRRQIF
jgi:hypothetical protein